MSPQRGTQGPQLSSDLISKTKGPPTPPPQLSPQRGTRGLQRHPGHVPRLRGHSSPSMSPPTREGTGPQAEGTPMSPPHVSPACPQTQGTPESPLGKGTTGPTLCLKHIPESRGHQYPPPHVTPGRGDTSLAVPQPSGTAGDTSHIPNPQGFPPQCPRVPPRGCGQVLGDAQRTPVSPRVPRLRDPPVSPQATAQSVSPNQGNPQGWGQGPRHFSELRGPHITPEQGTVSPSASPSQEHS